MENSITYDTVIIGAGLSGLSVAAFLKERKPESKILLLEQADRPGGAIYTHAEEGYMAEAGAHGFLDNCPQSRELVALAGLESEIVKAPLSSFGRYICLKGGLRLIPQTPGKILRAKLVPLHVKLRVLGDLGKKRLEGEPTVAQWVSHRFGAGLLPFADAVFTGTYAGDIERLSIDGVMPGVRELEEQYGSVIKGLWNRRKEKKAERAAKPKGLPAMTSFATGMSRLPGALAASLQPNREILFRTGVQSLVPGGDSWEVHTGQNSFRCRHLVLALPVNRAIELLRPASLIPRPPLTNIPEARIATVALGFPEEVRIPFGFGYLAPESEHRFTLGALFSSHMFSDRAPRQRFLLEALVGGRRHPERLDLDDGQLIDNVLEDLRQLLPLPAKPSFSRVLRPKSGIPQLEAGYPELLRWRNSLHDTFNSLHICGFGWKGIGINDMVKEASLVTERILTATGSEGKQQEVKGIYF